MIRYVLFDFDGTLVDSREVFVSSFNRLAEKYRFNSIAASNIDDLKKLSMMERLRYLNVPLYRLPFLTREFLSLYRSQLPEIRLIEGMAPVLEQINEMGIHTGIVSSNSVLTIKTFLENNKISGFSEVHSSGRLFGKDRVLRKFLKHKSLHSSEVLYVCDELRDIMACNKAQVKPIWVSWGFEMKEAVTHAGVAQVAYSTEELLDIIKKEHLTAVPGVR